MSEKFPQRRSAWWIRYRLQICVVAIFPVVLLVDFPLLHLVYIPPERGIVNMDLYRLFRVVGYLGTWILIGGLMMHNDRNRHRGLAVILSALLSGIAAELLKLIVSRERPVFNGVLQPDSYNFHGIFSGFYKDSLSLGFPSSHTAVAFGGCLMLAYFARNIRFVLILVATACGVTRMIVGAHFASDVYAGAILGWIVSAALVHTVPKDRLDRSDKHPKSETTDPASDSR